MGSKRRGNRNRGRGYGKQRKRKWETEEEEMGNRGRMNGKGTAIELENVHNITICVAPEKMEEWMRKNSKNDISIRSDYNDSDNSRITLMIIDFNASLLPYQTLQSTMVVSEILTGEGRGERGRGGRGEFATHT